MSLRERHSPKRRMRSRIDVVAMFVDTVVVICRGDEVDVVTVAATGMTRDAVQNLGAVHQVADVLLESISSRSLRRCSLSPAT